MEDTDLRVCRLCSENRTKKRIKQLHDGTYDVLVATAGSFLEMLNQKQIQVSLFTCSNLLSLGIYKNAYTCIFEI